MKLRELYMIYQAQKYREMSHSEKNYQLATSFYWDLFLTQEEDKEKFITLGNLINLQIEYKDIQKAKNYLEIGQQLLKQRRIKNSNKDISYFMLEEKYNELGEMIKNENY